MEKMCSAIWMSPCIYIVLSLSTSCAKSYFCCGSIYCGGSPGKRLMGSHAQFIVVIHNPVSAYADRIGRAREEAFAGCGPGAGIAAELRFVRLRTINGRSGKEV